MCGCGPEHLKATRLRVPLVSERGRGGVDRPSGMPGQLPGGLPGRRAVLRHWPPPWPAGRPPACLAVARRARYPDQSWGRWGGVSAPVDSSPETPRRAGGIRSIELFSPAPWGTNPEFVGDPPPAHEFDPPRRGN